MDFVAIAVHSRGRTAPPSFFFSPRGSLPAYPCSAAAIAVNGHGSIPNSAALSFFFPARLHFPFLRSPPSLAAASPLLVPPGRG